MARSVKVKAMCTDGREVERVAVEEREGKRFIYGLYYDPQEQRTKRCYVGPADPDYVLRSMPAALLVEPGTWIAALGDALLATAQNVAAYRPDLAPELARALRGALEALGEAGGRAQGCA